MDQNNQSFGSFGNVSSDGMEAIKKALLSRQNGTPTPALDTQSGASPTASPLPAEAMGGASMPQASSAPSALGAAVPQGNPEAKLIISAMKERLKAISQIEVGGQGGL